MKEIEAEYKRLKQLADDLKEIGIGIPVPVAIGIPKTHQVIDPHLVKGTRGYIERICTQINGCYESGYFDACSVMIRRFIETLIIEAFEARGIDNKIKNSNGDFFYLRDLISATLSESSWNLSRNVKKSLPGLKEVGDKSAHNRRFNAIKSDVDKIKIDLRDVVQELIHLANLK